MHGARVWVCPVGNGLVTMGVNRFFQRDIMFNCTYHPGTDAGAQRIGHTMTATLLRPLRPVHDLPGMPEAIGRALAAISGAAYVIVDAHTHAPITPYAPIRGELGIRADIQRAMPGLSALPVGEVAPARRASFADTLNRMADIELRVWNHYMTRLDDPSLSDTARDTLTQRLNRAAAEADRLSDRAHGIRRSLAR